jgi:hypothetical protein
MPSGAPLRYSAGWPSAMRASRQRSVLSSSLADAYARACWAPNRDRPLANLRMQIDCSSQMPIQQFPGLGTGVLGQCIGGAIYCAFSTIAPLPSPGSRKFRRNFRIKGGSIAEPRRENWVNPGKFCLGASAEHQKPNFGGEPRYCYLRTRFHKSCCDVECERASPSVRRSF